MHLCLQLAAKQIHGFLGASVASCCLRMRPHSPRDREGVRVRAQGCVLCDMESLTHPWLSFNTDLSQLFRLLLFLVIL